MKDLFSMSILIVVKYFFLIKPILITVALTPWGKVVVICVAIGIFGWILSESLARKYRHRDI